MRWGGDFRALLLLFFAPAVAYSVILDNGIISAVVQSVGITSITSSVTGKFDVSGDDFLVQMEGTILTPKTLPTPKLSQNDTTVQLVFSTSSMDIEVTYQLRSGASFVEKRISLKQSSSERTTTARRNITQLCLFNQTVVTVQGSTAASSHTASSHYGLKDYVLFQRWKSVGAMFTVQNPYLDASADHHGATLCYSPNINWIQGQEFSVDPGLLGVHQLEGRILEPPADPLDTAEQAAMTDALVMYLAVPQDPKRTIKVCRLVV